MWDSKAAGKSHEAQDTNRKPEHIRAQLERHYRRISDRDAYVTAERVKSAYLGMGEEYETLLEAFDKFDRTFKQHVGVDRAQFTYRKYDNVRKRLAEFLAEKLRREDIPLKEPQKPSSPITTSVRLHLHQAVEDDRHQSSQCRDHRPQSVGRLPPEEDDQRTRLS